MFRKNYFSFLLITALFLTGSIAVSAQTAVLTGKVEMQKADGAKVPVSDAMIEIFRTDINAGFPSTKTNNKGEFSVAGLPSGSTFVVSVSGAGISPEVTADLQAGTDSILINVSEGDGRRLTEEEVRKVIASPAGVAANAKAGELTAEQKKQKEEYEKIAKKNESTKEKTEIIKKNLEEGNKAFNDKNFDVAIVKFDEAYKVDTEFVGSAPVLLNNKAIALRNRAVINYNKRAKDKSLTAELTPKIKQDVLDAVTALDSSWKLLSAAAGADGTDAKAFEDNKQRTLTESQALFDVMLQMNLSPEGKKEEIKALTDAYVKVESDKAKKVNAYVNLGQYYSDIYDYDNSVSAFKNAVNIDSSDAEALGRLSLGLYTQSSLKADGGDAAAAKNLKQESLNYGQKYLDVAAKDHTLRGGISAVVDEIKKNDKLSPKKIN